MNADMKPANDWDMSCSGPKGRNMIAQGKKADATILAWFTDEDPERRLILARAMMHRPRCATRCKITLRAGFASARATAIVWPWRDSG